MPHNAAFRRAHQVCAKCSRGSLRQHAFRPHQLSQYKNTTVLVQVAIVLGKFAHSEDLVAIEEGVQSLTDILRVLMQLDPSPEVRRAALPGVHTPLNT